MMEVKAETEVRMNEKTARKKNASHWHNGGKSKPEALVGDGNGAWRCSAANG